MPPLWSIPLPLAGVLLAAAVFRAVYFYFYAGRSIFFDGLVLDSKMYDAWASALARGDWAGSQAFYFAPLYPYLLGSLFVAIGHSLAAVYLIQALLGLVNLVLVYRVGLAIFGERAGFWAAVLAALYGPFAFYETKILGATLGLSLNLMALALLVAAERAAPSGRGAPGRWLAAGLATGAAAACLPGTILLAPLYAIALALRRRVLPAAVLLAGTFLATVPTLAHNLLVASDPLPLSGQGGLTFYQGNNPNAAGLYSVPPGFSGSPESQAAEEQSKAERETGRSMRRSEVSAHFLRKGLEYIASAPLSWLVLEGRKVLALVGDYEASTEYSFYFERREIPWLYLPFLPFAAIAGAALGGMILAGRPRPPALALCLYTVYAAAVPLIFYVSSRYRLPLVPALLIYAGVFVDRLSSAGRGSSVGFTSAQARPAALALVLALVSFFPLGRPVASAEANVHYTIGNLLADQKRYEEAIASFDRAVAGFPRHAYAWINRGNSLDKLGREDEALASYRRAEEADPGFWLAYKAQGIILHREKRYAEEEAAYRRGLATDGEEAWYLLGVALKNLDRLDEAVRAFEQATRINPAYARAYARLGEIHAGRGQADQARDELRKALAADPGDAAALAALRRLGG